MADVISFATAQERRAAAKATDWLNQIILDRINGMPAMVCDADQPADESDQNVTGSI